MIVSMGEQLSELYAEREKLTAFFGDLDADGIIAYVTDLKSGAAADAAAKTA